jgi:hypothetical protein
MDQHVPAEVTAGLRRRGVDVLTTQEDGTSEADDDVLLALATASGRLMVSEDQDFLAITHEWVEAGRPFSGLVHYHPLKITVGRIIDDLEVIAHVLDRRTSTAGLSICDFRLPAEQRG